MEVLDLVARDAKCFRSCFVVGDENEKTAWFIYYTLCLHHSFGALCCEYIELALCLDLQDICK